MEWLSNNIISQYFDSVQNLSLLHKIEKGFSGEEKYILQDRQGYKYLLRTQDIAHSQSMKSHYDSLKRLSTLSIPMTKPIMFMEMPREKKVSMLLTYLEGTDAEEGLYQLTEQEQYEAGRKAGKALKEIHRLESESLKEDWEAYKSKKHQRYIDKLTKMPIYYDKYRFVLEYIDINIHRMKNRPSVFLHDDFHPSNLIINQQDFAGVIDFNRYEWGDPIHDFHKIALFTRNISIPFSVGQIHGYFNGEPDNDFWDLYTLYAAMVVISAFVWTIDFTPKLIKEMMVRVDQIIMDHQEFHSTIPKWYYKSS